MHGNEGGRGRRAERVRGGGRGPEGGERGPPGGGSSCRPSPWRAPPLPSSLDPPLQGPHRSAARGRAIACRPMRRNLFCKGVSTARCLARDAELGVGMRVGCGQLQAALTRPGSGLLLSTALIGFRWACGPAAVCAAKSLGVAGKCSCQQAFSRLPSMGVPGVGLLSCLCPPCVPLVTLFYGHRSSAAASLEEC